VTDAYAFEAVELGLVLAEAEVLALVLALAVAEALAEALALALVLALAVGVAFFDAEIFTELAVGAGVVRVSAPAAVCVATAVLAGAMSAVAWFGALLGECPLIVIAAATPPGAPTTVPASAATVIAGYFRVQDWLASERTMGDLRLCLA
jgi:hypothetical protein